MGEGKESRTFGSEREGEPPSDWTWQVALGKVKDGRGAVPPHENELGAGREEPEGRGRGRGERRLC